ncbi:7855_t:CDS:1, partial [Cetraspora pellucida]
MDEGSIFDQFNEAEFTSTSNSIVSQNEFEPEALTEITNRSSKRKIDPFWDEHTVTGNKQHCNYCDTAYSMDTGLSTIKKHFKHNHPDRWDELIKIVNKTNIEPYNADKILQINHSLVKWIITDQQAFSI